MKTKTLCIAVVTAGFALASVSAHASVIITPLLSTETGSVTSSTTFFDANRAIDSALDGSGLSSGGTSGDILTETHNNAATDSVSHFLSNGPVANEVLTFDLGATFDVTEIYLWQYNRTQFNRGIINFDIAFSTDGGSSFTSPVAASSLGITDFVIGTIGGVASVQQRSFNSVQSGVTAIQFSNIQTGGSTSIIGLPEVRFGFIPEPASLALLGLGGLLLAGRNRR